MKYFFLVLVFLNSLTGFCQYTEFGESKNGLIYPDSTIAQLKHIVDSLNLKFRYCDLSKTFVGKPQARAQYIYLEKGDIEAARNDMQAGLDVASFLAKYPVSVVEKQTYVVKYAYENYKHEQMLEFSSIGLSGSKEKEMTFKENLAQYNRPFKNTWVYNYHDSSRYSGAYIQAFYFLENLQQPVIPEAYARMIQYSDCLVDTAATIFYKDAQVWGGWFDDYKIPEAITTFMAYLDSINPPPKRIEGQKEQAYDKQYDAWYKKRYSTFDRLHKNDSVFNMLLKSAVQAGMEQGGTTEEFEEYVGRYVSKNTEPEMKRHRKVYGMCSMDQSPRYHALNIAMLSAETNRWEIFLRAHLDIMNDRFNRASDGNYAYGRRQTYIKELEVLDINVPDLLLGISMRIDNPSSNHYFGSISRTGRALSESKNAVNIENRMLAMISDQQLDINNRLALYYLFLNYNEYVADEKKQRENRVKLHKAVLSLPDFIAEQWKEDK